MHIVYANVHSRAFALLALITRLPILGGNLPFAKRPISDHSEPIPNLHGKGIFWPHRSWKIQLTAHNHHLKSYFWKVPANILLVGIFAPWSLHCSALSSQSWLGCENAKQLRSGCLSSDRSNGRGSLHLGLLNSARRVHAIWMKRGYCRIYPIMNHDESCIYVNHVCCLQFDRPSIEASKTEVASFFTWSGSICDFVASDPRFLSSHSTAKLGIAEYSGCH